MAITGISQGRIIELNHGFCQLFGYSREECLGRSPMELGIWVDLKDRAAIIEHLKEHQDIHAWPVKMRHKDGTILQVQFSGRVATLEEYPEPLMVSLVVDVSSELRAREMVRQKEEHFRLLIENIHDMVAELDVQGVYLYASPNHLGILGYSPEFLCGRKTSELVHPDDLDEWGKSIAVKGTTFPVIRIRKANGSWCHVQLSTTGYEFPATGARLIIALRDVTDQVIAKREHERVEQLLRHTQKMDAIGTLAGGIAHDFNNILSGIMGYGEMVRDQLDVSSQAHSDIECVLQGAQRAKGLVRQILTFCRQERNEKQRLDMKALVGEVAAFIHSTVPRNVGIILQLPDSLPFIMADPVQMHQVLMNLCTNSAHAIGDKQGRITLQLEPCEIDSEFLRLHPDLQAGPHLRISVSDTGCGMNQEVLKRIFEPFYTTKAPNKGTGLGLSVVHGIIKELGGSIYVYSQEGEGTNFQIYLPAVADDPSTRQTQTPTVIPLGHGENILFVDDELTLGAAAERILTKLGYHVTVINDPLSALPLLEKSPHAFQLLFTDYSMPGMNGLGLAEAAHEMNPELVIVMATGFAANLTKQSLAKAGIQELALKPVTTEGYASILNKCLGKRAVNSSSP